MLALLFSNVHVVISTVAPSSIDTDASVELPNVNEVNVPLVSFPLNCTREASQLQRAVDGVDDDEGLVAEKMQFVEIALPFTAMMFPGGDDYGVSLCFMTNAIPIFE